MTATKGLGTYGNGVGTVTPLDHKMAQLGIFAKTAANTIRAGVLWDGNPTIVSGKANMSYDVRAFAAVLSRSSTAGAVLLTNDGTLNLATDVTGAALAAPGSNSRYHLVFVWQREYSLDGSDSNPVIGVIQGASAASPTVPSLAAYPGAIELARILVPAGVTATNSGTTITQTAVFTAAAGGIVAVRNSTERDAGSWVEGQQIYNIATDTVELYTGTAWVSAPMANLQLDTANSTERLIIQSGIGYIDGLAASTISKAVTFPVAFKASTVPSVSVNMMGQKTSGAFAPTGLSATQSLYASGMLPSNTGFTAYIYQTTGGNLTAANDYYFSWTAVGVAA